MGKLEKILDQILRGGSDLIIVNYKLAGE